MDYKIPLDDIVDCKDNIYKISTLAIKEAVKLAKEKSEEFKKEFGSSKITAVALSKAFSNEINYSDNSSKISENKRK